MKEINLINGAHGFIGGELKKVIVSHDDKVVQGERRGKVPPGIDRIFDLAAYGNMYDQTDLREIYHANLTRVVDLLANAEEVDYKSCVLVSTSSVLIPHQTYYSLSKKAMEEFACKWAVDHERPIVVVRPTTIIGVGEQKARLIPKLIDSCLHGTEMPFVSEPTHDFIDVRDFVDGMIFVSRRAKDLSGRVINIGSGTTVSNWTIKGLVEKITGKVANVKEVENMRVYDTKEWKVDTSDIRLLGWKPRYSLGETIKSMVDNYDNK